MGKKPKSAGGNYLVDRFEMNFSARPLRGLAKLVKLRHPKRNGILQCDNVLRQRQAIAFSEANQQTTPYEIEFRTPISGVFGQPRIEIVNDAPERCTTQFHDFGTEFVFKFLPKAGASYAVECDMYKSFDPGHRYARWSMPANMRIAICEVTLDVSQYLKRGYIVTADAPRCEFESSGARRSRDGAPRAVALPAKKLGKGSWSWTVQNIVGGTFRMAWELEPCDSAAGSETANLDRLATELSVNPRLAKDLHNFMGICHYYVAGFRSLNMIGPEMITSKSVLRWSLESIEDAIGAETFERTKGKGLIQITPAGEAVLEWWSHFYMRWTPISPDFIAPQNGAGPIRAPRAPG